PVTTGGRSASRPAQSLAVEVDKDGLQSGLKARRQIGGLVVRTKSANTSWVVVAPESRGYLQNSLYKRLQHVKPINTRFLLISRRRCRLCRLFPAAPQGRAPGLLRLLLRRALRQFPLPPGCHLLFSRVEPGKRGENRCFALALKATLRTAIVEVLPQHGSHG